MFLRIAFAFFAAGSAFAQGTKVDYERADSLAKRTEGKVFRTRVEPYWLPGGDSFWYRVEIAPGKFENVFVDCLKGERRAGYKPPADAGKPAVLAEPHASRGSDEPTFIIFNNKTAEHVVCWWIASDGKRHRYALLKPGECYNQRTFVGDVWVVESGAHVRIGVFEASAGGGEAVIDGSRKDAKTQSEEKSDDANSLYLEPSLAGQFWAEAAQILNHQSSWNGFVRNNNVWVRNLGTHEEAQLSCDGMKDDAYREPVIISPDGTRAVAMRVKPEQEHLVHFVESSPKDQVQPKLHSHQYIKPGDRIRHERPCLFDLEKRAPVAVDDALFSKPWSITDLRWQPDSSEFTFLYNERGHQVLRVVGVDRAGAARTLVEEKSATFVD